jgi:nucleoside-diphosphate-sugar epimerase
VSQSVVLVIGAAGFIGSWVTRSLCSAGFANIRAGVMSTARPIRLQDVPLQLVPCDLLDTHTLAAAMDGAEIVINCARGPAESDVALEGTRKLLASAAELGVRRLIQMSSVAVYGQALGTVTEDTPPVAPFSKYAADKQAAEALCQAAAGDELTVAIVRPSLVYGPYGEEWTGRFIRAIGDGQLGQLGSAGNGDANLIYAGDLGRFTAHLAAEDLPPYSIYNANGLEIPTFNEFFNRLSWSLGFGTLPSSCRRPIGGELTRHARRVGRFVLRKQKTRLRKLATTSRILTTSLDWAESTLRLGVHDGPPDQYAQRVIYSIDRARRIGFVPQTTLKEGIEASALWARSQGMKV